MYLHLKFHVNLIKTPNLVLERKFSILYDIKVFLAIASYVYTQSIHLYNLSYALKYNDVLKNILYTVLY